MSSATSADRRDNSRAPIELKVEYKRLNSFFFDYTRNISKGGTFIRTERPLPIGTDFVFSLELPTIERTIRLVGRVQWVTRPEEATEEKPAGMGISFVFQSDNERREVESLVEGLMVDALGETLSSKLLGKQL
ncbi:MAG: TIGR02266 family protein [Polyangiaceae bacterium]